MNRPFHTIKEKWKLESFCPVHWRIKFFMLLSNICQCIKQKCSRKFGVEVMIQARYPPCNNKEKIHASWTEMSGKGQMFVDVERHENKREEDVTPFSQFSYFKVKFLEGNINYISIPQMATSSTIRLLRYVFQRGSSLVPKFLVQIMSRLNETAVLSTSD